MPQPINAVCFAQPHWEVIARGFDTERWFNDGQAAGTGGIFNPQPVNLRMGLRYYRFTSSTSSRAAQVGGGWWMEAETFFTIRRFAQEHGYGLADAARLFLALPYEWTRVDRVVKAFLAAPLRAYAGRGKVAQSDGSTSRWIPVQHIPVTQYYIPGLFTKGEDGRPLFEVAFPSPEFSYVANVDRLAPSPV
jgi:hypothetical protein